MTGLGMSTDETTHFTDILAKTATSTNTSVSLMGDSFKFVAPVAGQLGIKAEDLGVALGIMANASIKGSMAGRQLRQGLSRMTGSVDSVNKVMKKYNISLQTNKDGSVDLMGTITHLKDRLKDLSKVEKSKVLGELFGTESLAGWSALLDNSEQATKKMEELTEGIYNCNGTAKEMSKIMGDNFKGKLNNLSSAFEGVKISVGEILIPVLEKLVVGLTNVFKWFNELDSGTKKIIVGFGAFLAVLGPLMMVLPKLIKGFGLLKAGFIALKSGVGLTASAMLTIKMVLASVGIAFVGFMAYIGSSSDMLQSLQDNFGTFGTIVGGVCEFLYGTFQLTFGNLGILITTLGKMFMALVKGDFKEVGNIWQDGLAEMEANTAKAGSNMAMHTTKSISRIKEMSAPELEKLKGHFDDTMGALKTVTVDNIDKSTAIFVEKLKSMDNDTINTLKGTSDSMAILFEGISANMTDEQATNVFKGNLEAMVRSGELNLSQLEADTEEFSKIVANNISTGSHQMEIKGKELWTNFKDVSTRGIDEVSMSMANDIQNMNQSTFESLQSMGGTWGQVFAGIEDVSQLSTQQIADIVKKNYTDMNMSSEKLMEAMEKDMETYMSSMVDTSAEKSSEISTNVENGVDGASEAINTEMNEVNNSVSEGMSNASNTASQGAQNVKNNLDSGTQGTKEAVKNNVDVATVVQQEVNEAVNASKNAEGVKTNINNAMNGVGAGAKSGLNEFNNSVDSATKNATKTADTNTRGMKNAVDKNTKDLSKTAEKNFKAIDNSAKSNFTTATDRVKKDATSMYNGAKTSFTKTADNAVSSFTRLKESIINQTAIAKNSAVNNWNTIRDTYAKSITGTITITKKTVEKTVSSSSNDDGKKALIRSLISLDNNELMARKEAMSNLSNVEAGGRMALSNTGKKSEEKSIERSSKNTNNITYNYSYTSPTESSISELRRKDRVQAQRMALSFK